MTNATKPPKIIQNPYEQIGGLAKETAKETVKAVGDIINPTNLFAEIMGLEKPAQNIPNGKEKDLLNKPKATPLDFNKLNGKYQDQEKMKMDALRNKLFQLVKSDEQKAIETRKKEEEERKKKFEEEEQRKKQEEQQQIQNGQNHAESAGKQKGQLGQARKKASTDVTIENKANRSKQ